jgi:hypothetical protein
MKKKIAADLTSLAHRILQMKNKNDVTELQAVAKELYEKLTVLAFTEKHFSDVTPTAGSKEIEERLEKAYSEAQENAAQVSNEVEKVMETVQDEVEQAFSNHNLSNLFVPVDEDDREEMDLPGISTIQKMVLEMPDEIPYKPETEPEQVSQPEETESETTATPEAAKDLKPETNLSDFEVKQQFHKNDFEEITADYESMPVFERKVNDTPDKPLSVNDRLNKGLKIGMNDRLGFIKHLFNGNTEDFNRVLSQLNTITTIANAQHFIDTMVKPEYNNWMGKDLYADRFMELVTRNYS